MKAARSPSLLLIYQRTLQWFERLIHMQTRYLLLITYYSLPTLDMNAQSLNPESGYGISFYLFWLVCFFGNVGRRSTATSLHSVKKK